MLPVITVENLSKRYIIGHKRQERYSALRDVMADAVKRGFRKLLPHSSGGNADSTREEFWALKDVSFEINQGDRVGIIGRNGAGKSTLLKVLSRITEPTSGRIKLNGRVASLLEVGTGFHPELTGRENIFLNGAILGMRKEEIKIKFDEIVAFAEVERFLDTPVKHYSSGMYVRLAFAVAAHLEPEILVVDEVLAVGDAKFQEKCLNKMGEIANQGLTVLFVSHNMSAIINLCNKGIMLESGKVKYSGNANNAVAEYREMIKVGSSVDLESFNIGRRGHQLFAKFIAMKVVDQKGNERDMVAMGESISVRLTISIKENLRHPRIGIMIRNSMNVLIHDITSAFDGLLVDFQPGIYTLEVTVPEIRLYPGRYTFGPWIQQQVGVASDDYIEAALGIEVLDNRLIGHSDAKFDLIKKEGSETYQPSHWRVV
jgi:lipopolysaccharide transport system ATP-binding protein